MHEIPSETEEGKQEQYYFSVGSNIIGGGHYFVISPTMLTAYLDETR